MKEEQNKKVDDMTIDEINSKFKEVNKEIFENKGRERITISSGTPMFSRSTLELARRPVIRNRIEFTQTPTGMILPDYFNEAAQEVTIGEAIVNREDAAMRAVPDSIEHRGTFLYNYSAGQYMQSDGAGGYQMSVDSN